MNTKTDLIEEVRDNQDAKGTDSYERVGAGNWTVEIKKLREEDGEGTYELRLVARTFSPQDLFDLPKLTHGVAAVIADDGCLEPSLRDDLWDLSHAMDWFANPAVRGAEFMRLCDELEERQGQLSNVGDSDGPAPSVYVANDDFGVCPICLTNDGYLNVSRANWFVCHRHQTKWCVGIDVFPTWRRETEDTWSSNFKRIWNYRVVIPILGVE